MSKYIVKLEFCDTPNMVLSKNVSGYKRGSIMPYSFQPYNGKYEVAYFAEEKEAEMAVEEASKHYSHSGIPVIMKVVQTKEV